MKKGPQKAVHPSPSRNRRSGRCRFFDFNYFDLVDGGSSGAAFRVKALKDHTFHNTKFHVKEGQRYVIKAFDNPATPTKPLHANYTKLSNLKHKCESHSCEVIRLKIKKQVEQARKDAMHECYILKLARERRENHRFKRYFPFPECYHDGVPKLLNDDDDEKVAGFPPDFLILEDAGAGPEIENAREYQRYNWEQFVFRFNNPRVISEVYVSILKQALEALVFLQDTGFIHHNLHEDNVALRIYYLEEFDHWKPVVRVSEFGNMIEASEDYLCVDAATNSNHPPEYNQQSGNCGMFDPKHPFAYDLYMMGGYLMQILTGDSWTITTLNGLSQEPQTFKTRADLYAENSVEQAVAMRLSWTKDVCTSSDTGEMQTMPVEKLMQIVSKPKREEGEKIPDNTPKWKKFLFGYPKAQPEEEPNDVYTKVWQGYEKIEIKGHEFRFELLEVIAQMLTYEAGLRGTAKGLLEQSKRLLEEPN